MIRVCRVYKHWKGGEVVVLNIAMDSETLEKYVIHNKRK